MNVHVSIFKCQNILYTICNNNNQYYNRRLERNLAKKRLCATPFKCKHTLKTAEFAKGDHFDRHIESKGATER